MKTKVYLQNNKIINVGDWDEKRVKETRVVLNDEIIHIGTWDLQEQHIPVVVRDNEILYPYQAGTIIPDGAEIKMAITYANPLPEGAVIEEFEIITNPIPQDAIETEIEIITTAKGRIVSQSDYRSLRADEYPNITDQLDALWKGGEALEAMQAQILAVKQKYPKSELSAT